MSQLQVIHEQNVLGKTFKVYGTKEAPLFLAKDVATWIEHTNVTVMMKAIDEDEKVLNNVYTLGGAQKAIFLTEDGLYEVLMQSRKPIAKQFKKQVKAVLKEIRLNGGYIAVSEEEDDSIIMARALLVAQRAIERKDKLIQEANQVIEEQAPKVEKFDKFLEVDGTLTITNVIVALRERGLGCVYTRSPHMLNSFLKEQGIQYKHARQNFWTLKVDYVWLQEEGYAVSRQIETHSGYATQLRWTPLGVDFIAELIESESGEF
ncbi:antirepressor protein [Bacillus phage Anath]|uniref:Antirepressor protein n=1 Tax=Bacillus phage Anath TaxID=2108114 RepID=A0A2P1JUI0_9CAUD|nr:antirepressor protein [Bacillus phage Anath]